MGEYIFKADVKTEDLIAKVKSLELSSSDFAIFGRGIMYMYGISTLENDIDLVVRGSALERISELVDKNMFGGSKKIYEFRNETYYSFYDGMVEAWKTWAPGIWDLDELIDTAVEFEGLCWVNLGNVLKWKKASWDERKRPKDLEHIKLIEQYLETMCCP